MSALANMLANNKLLALEILHLLCYDILSIHNQIYFLFKIFYFILYMIILIILVSCNLKYDFIQIIMICFNFEIIYLSYFYIKS